MKWDIKRFAITGGIMWGILLFITTLFSVYTGYAKPFLDVIASIYPGYSISVIGSIIGLVYGFIDIIVAVYLFTWVYKIL